MHLQYNNCKSKVNILCEVWTLMPWAIFKAVNKFDHYVGEPSTSGKVSQSVDSKVSVSKEL